MIDNFNLSTSGLIENTTQIALIILVIYLYFRNKNILKHIVWTKFTGSTVTFTDKYIEKAARYEQDLDQAKIFFSNFRFSTKRELKAFLKWCKQRNITHEEFNGLGHYLKYKGKKVELTKTRIGWNQLIFFSVFFILLFPLLASLHFSLHSWVSKGVIKVGTTSNTIVLLDEDSATRLSLNPFNRLKWKLSPENCSSSEAARKTLSQAEHKTLCNWLATGESRKIAEKHHKVDFYTLLGLFLILSVIASGAFRQIVILKNLSIISRKAKNWKSSNPRKPRYPVPQ